MLCPICKAELATGKLYCPNCDVWFRPCPSCLLLVDARALKCPDCGHPLPGIAPDELFGEIIETREEPSISEERISRIEVGEAPARPLKPVSDQPQGPPPQATAPPSSQTSAIVEGEETFFGRMPWELSRRKSPHRSTSLLYPSRTIFYIVIFRLIVIAIVSAFALYFMHTLLKRVSTLGLEDFDSVYSTSLRFIEPALWAIFLGSVAIALIYAFLGFYYFARKRSDTDSGGILR